MRRFLRQIVTNVTNCLSGLCLTVGATAILLVLGLAVSALSLIGHEDYGVGTIDNIRRAVVTT